MNEEILRAAALLAPGGVVEVRALSEAGVHSGYFDDPAELAGRVEVLDADPSVAGIYVTLNPVNGALLARRANRIKMRLSKKDATTADADIVKRRWLPIDIDPVRPSGVSSTEEEHNLALATAETIAAWLGEQGFPAPVRADSGNGAHLLYRIDLPNDNAAKDLVRGCLAALDALFSTEQVTVDTANHNAARIWKLYGTASRKGDSTPERPHRRARLLAVPDDIAVVPVERLQHLAGLLPTDEPPAPRKGRGIDLAAWLAGHGIGVRSAKPYRGGTLYVLADCPFSPAHTDGAFAIQFANGAIFAGCHHTSCGGGRQRWPELRARCEKPKRDEEPPAPPLPPQEDEHRRRALEILRQGDPLGFLLDTFNKTHVGDRIVAECLAMSLASQIVENTSGLHVAISGNSGKGKTHACTTMLKQVPEQYRLAGTVSDKALYYNDRLCPGTVFLFDDTALSDDLQEILKAATANFRDRIEHHTLTADRHLRICSIPERCVWWLAKVENVGDDQVANRMLTVWIDDSKEQDKRVLEHLKQQEMRVPGAADTADVLVCRAIWDVLRQERVHVSIPFADRIRFSSAANRRNPAMLFDLIKACALLNSLQRERFASSEGSAVIKATRKDFAVALRIYTGINGEAGGQETKLTRNEAAALRTVEAMGVEVFTIRMLQQAMGFSYHQARRILHGYTSRGTTYSGLLEKCPAIGFSEATVTDDSCGSPIRRREQHYSFDIEVYRLWSSVGGVWLDDGDGDGCTIAAGLQQISSTCCKESEGRNGGETAKREGEKRDYVRTCTYVQQNEKAHSTDASVSRDAAGVCDPPVAATERPREPSVRQMAKPGADLHQNDCSRCCNSAATVPHVVHRTGKVLPLPGLLDHRTFERTRVELGRCTICDAAKAVYRSPEAQAKICEGCYARLVREWNRGKGVR